MDTRNFIPMTRSELEAQGCQRPDYVIVSADAYVDHPSFANALIGRYLQSLGYQVGMIAQPDWNDLESFREFGEPKYAFLVSGGNMDSMVNMYTANKKKRHEDIYSPGAKANMRPKRATIVYANKLRQAYPKVPIIIGGVEASLRRFAHYDYWDDKVRRSILLDSGADLLVYGMGEKPLFEITQALEGGLAIRDITYIRGTAYLANGLDKIYEKYVCCPSFEEVAHSKEKYAVAFRQQYLEQDSVSGKIVVQQHGTQWVVQNPPAEPLTQEEMDAIYELPFQREQHPSYQQEIPALKEVKFSLTSSRGCFGGCAFCSIFFHQGRFIQHRSKKSLVEEAKKLIQKPDFKGYIHDVGGPTANFTQMPCEKSKKQGFCKEKRCLAPKPCKNLQADHREYVEILRALRGMEGVKKVFIRSGIRFDYVMADRQKTFLYDLAKHHVSGQLKVAPEHVSSNVLAYMGKPDHEVYERFLQSFEAVSKKLGKKQYVLPYFMSAHPGARLEDAIVLAEYIRDSGFMPEQVQDFYPTPGTLATCMYYTGLDPMTGKKVYVPKSSEERAMQRALLQYKKPENYQLVKKALLKAGREDLIGPGKRCLLKERRARSHSKQSKAQWAGPGEQHGSRRQSDVQRKGKSALAHNHRSDQRMSSKGKKRGKRP